MRILLHKACVFLSYYYCMAIIACSFLFCDASKPTLNLMYHESTVTVLTPTTVSILATSALRGNLEHAVDNNAVWCLLLQSALRVTF